MVAQHVAEGMAARGHQVTVLTSRFDRSLAAEETLNGVRVIRLPALMRVSRGWVMPGFPRAVRELAAEHDTVQIHSPMLEAALTARAAQQAGKRIVITHHGDLVMPRRPFDQLVQVGVTTLLRMAFRRADRVVVYTRDYLDHSEFLRPFVSKAVPILPPVFIPAPSPEQATAWRAELGVANAPLIGFAGRFVEEKGFDFLLRAVPIVAREFPTVRFAYAGDRNVAYEDFYDRCRPLVERADDHLLWLGLLRDRQQLADFYRMCDLIAVPSRTDNLPLVPLEAMRCGTPAVVTDIPGARVSVQLSGMGLLVRPRDEVALAAGIMQVLRDRARYLKPQAEIDAVFDPVRSLDAYEAALFGDAPLNEDGPG